MQVDASGVILDAEIRGSGMKIDATVGLMLSTIESHHGLFSRG